MKQKLHKNSNFDIQGYNVIRSNLKVGKEGILVAAKQGTFNSIEKTYEAESRNLTTVEIKYPEDTLSVVVVHGPQEEAQQEIREEFYEDLKAEVERCVASGNRLLITGDFNARLEHDEGNLKASKGNGKQLQEVVEMYGLKVLNIDPHTDGKWTRIQKKGNEYCKSVIDFIITDGSTQKKTNKVTIDEDKMYTPYRNKKEGKNSTLVFTDHCTMTTSIKIRKGADENKQKPQKMKVWMIEEDGLKEFKKLTEGDV